MTGLEDRQIQYEETLEYRPNRKADRDRASRKAKTEQTDCWRQGKQTHCHSANRQETGLVEE